MVYILYGEKIHTQKKNTGMIKKLIIKWLHEIGEGEENESKTFLCIHCIVVIFESWIGYIHFLKKIKLEKQMPQIENKLKQTNPTIYKKTG